MSGDARLHRSRSSYSALEAACSQLFLSNAAKPLVSAGAQANGRLRVLTAGMYMVLKAASRQFYSVKTKQRMTKPNSRAPRSASLLFGRAW